MSTALLMLHLQTYLFAPQTAVYQPDTLAQTLTDLLTRARAAQVPIIYLQNAGTPGQPDEPETAGWAIFPPLSPTPHEPVLSQDTPNAFHHTHLPGLLAEKGIRRLVIAGLQTELEIDTAVRHAWHDGYDVVLAADGHSTHTRHLSAPQIIAHHNQLLARFAMVLPTADISFTTTPRLQLDEPFGTHDLTAIAGGLAEADLFDRWLTQGDGRPFWPHTHPSLIAHALRRLWDPRFVPRSKLEQPAGWEMSMARQFIQPLGNMPEFYRKTAVQAVDHAMDHLLQSPTNPLSPQMRRLTPNLWSYDAREFRLIYSPRLLRDRNGRNRKIVFLLWIAPALPTKNPFM